MSRDWVTFDCYGTLADWLGGMRNALTPHVGAEDAERLLHAYHDLEAEVEAQRPRPSYREVLTETLRRAAEREGIALPAGSETALVDHWHELPIFDDVGPALGALRENGWSLAILSNCDDDLLATTLERMPVPFDLTVTAEQVGSYKPDPGHWRAFTRAHRGRPRPLGPRGAVVVPRHRHRRRARPPARLGRPPRLRRGPRARDGADPGAEGAAGRGRAGRFGGLNFNCAVRRGCGGAAAVPRPGVLSLSRIVSLRLRTPPPPTPRTHSHPAAVDVRRPTATAATSPYAGRGLPCATSPASKRGVVAPNHV